MIAGFLLTSAGTHPGAIQGLLFGFGILLWVIGGLGTVYCVVYRLAGPKAAKLVVPARDTHARTSLGDAGATGLVRVSLSPMYF
jgi:hypothetical protein